MTEQPTEAAGEQRGPSAFTATDLVAAPDPRRIWHTPRATRDALRLVWQSSPRQLAVMMGLQLVAGAGIALQLLVAKRIMEELIAVSRGGDAEGLILPFAAFACISFVVAGLTAAGTHQQRLLAELVGRYSFNRIIEVGGAVDFRRFETPQFYDQLQRAMSSGDFRILDMVTSVTQLTSALLTSVGIGVVLLFLEPLLLGFVLLAAVPAMLAAVRNSKESYAFAYAMTPESRERAYVLSLMTSRTAAKEVRLLGLGEHLRQRYERLTDERLRHLRAFLKRRLGVSLLGAFASSLGMAIALGALVALLAADRIDVATALTAGLAMQQLAARLQTITGSIAKLVESAMFLDDFQTFVAAAPADSDRPPHASHEQVALPDVRQGHVLAESISFTYPGAPAPTLSDVTLEVKPGEIVALVGSNGSGKTTLVKLLTGLYQPDAGRVLWNGIDAAALDPPAIAAQVTVVFQDYLQYHLRALDNIVFGRIERADDRDAAMEAAAHAGADAFLQRLPSGYETRLGLQFHGGRELSIGQWQRLALARAFFRGGNFLILDEPTASLDPRAEQALFEQMRRLREGRSVLLISHRFSSVRSADRIYVLDEGRVTETGTHEQLVEAGGLYAELFEIQAAAYLGEGRNRTLSHGD